MTLHRWIQLSALGISFVLTLGLSHLFAARSPGRDTPQTNCSPTLLGSLKACGDSSWDGFSSSNDVMLENRLKAIEKRLEELTLRREWIREVIQAQEEVLCILETGSESALDESLAKLFNLLSREGEDFR